MVVSFAVPSLREFLAALVSLAAACAPASANCQGAPQGHSGLVLQKYALRAAGRAAMEPPSSRAIAAGLDWLGQHQSKGGRWDCDRFMTMDIEGLPCDGPGSAEFDVGVSGLALLAFLADTNATTGGRYERILFDGLKWLRDQQQPNGLFGSNASSHFIYNHSIATYAICEAAAITNDPVLRRSAQLGIDYLESHRNPYSVWRYKPRSNDNDISVTGWCTMAYATAHSIGLRVNASALLLTATFLDQVADTTGKHGYTKLGESSAREPGAHGIRFPTEKSESLTAIGLQCRFFLGQDLAKKPAMNAAAKRIRSKMPRWDEKGGSIDLYYWYHASQAMTQVGGVAQAKWRTALAAALLPNQREDGNFAGSWDPVSVWSGVGGRVYSTALSVLSLQAEYRYARLVDLTPLPGLSRYLSANRAFGAQRYQLFANLLDKLLAKNEDDAEIVAAIAAARVSLLAVERRYLGDIERIAKAASYWHGMDRLKQVETLFGSLPPGAAARAVIDEWQEDPQVQRELAAMKRFKKLEMRFDAASSRSRKAMRGQLERCLDRYQGTRAAELVEKLLRQIR